MQLGGTAEQLHVAFPNRCVKPKKHKCIWAITGVSVQESACGNPTFTEAGQGGEAATTSECCRNSRGVRLRKEHDIFQEPVQSHPSRQVWQVLQSSTWTLMQIPPNFIGYKQHV